MSVPYDIQVIKAPGDGREHALARSLDDALRAHGLHLVIDLRLSADEPTNEPSVVVFLGSAEAVADDQCRSAAQVALDAGRVVVPVATAPDRVGDELLPVLSGNNAWIWDGPDPANRLARLVLEELGIEENQRRVFISHRRLDGLLMAEQLHDELSHRRFQPFIDRFAIPAGAEVQDSVADALESFAFLLLLESPFASGSEWVFYEVEYALSHAMGICIVRWPGDIDELPGTHGLPRLELGSADVIDDHGYQVLTPEAVGRVVAEVEQAHAAGLIRRRRNLLVSIADAAAATGRPVLGLTGWRLLVGDLPHDQDVVGVATRLPVVDDLFRVDQAAEAILGLGHRVVLVHAARRLKEERRELLAWAAGGRSIRLVPENAIGRYW